MDIPFDTHHFVTKLTKAGMPQEHAEAVCDAVKTSFAEADFPSNAEMHHIDIAVKSILREFRAELKADMKEFSAGIKNDINTLEYRLIIKVGGICIASIGIMAALLKLL